jgi:ornithine cyclodeaminase
MGSDTTKKQELDAAILARADVVVADSLAQCLERGEIFKAMQSGHIRQEDARELGDIIAGTAEGRTSEEQITVADLTGVAVQDMKIASAVYDALDQNLSQ